MSDRPWVQGKRFRELDNEEYANELLTTPFAPGTQSWKVSSAAWDAGVKRFKQAFDVGKGVAGASVDTIADFTRLVGRPVEFLLVAEERMKAHVLSDLTGQDWNSNSGKTFRYNNSVLYPHIGTFIRGVKSSYMRDGALAEEYPDVFGDGKMLGSSGFTPWAVINPMDSPVGHLARGIAYAKMEGERGNPWAKGNPEEMRNGLLDDFNPLWLDSAVAKMYMTAKQSAHVKAMVPFAERMIAAAKAKDGDAFHLVANGALYGKDVSSKAFRQGWMAVARAGHTAEELAGYLYTAGHRSPGVGPAFADFNLSSVPKFFKKPGEPASGAIIEKVVKFFERGGHTEGGKNDDLAYTFMKKGQKLSDFFRDTINEIGTTSSQAADEALYLLSHVRRDAPTAMVDGAWDTRNTLASFRQNYQINTLNGTIKEVSAKGFEYAQRLVHATTQGWKTDVKWNSLLAPSKEFAGGTDILTEATTKDMKRFWLNPAREAAETISPDRLATWAAKYKTHEQVFDEANGLFAEARAVQKNIGDAQTLGAERIRRAEALMAGKPNFKNVSAAEKLEIERLAAGGPRAILEAKMEIHDFSRQHTAIDGIIRSFKEFKTTPDYIAELKKSEPVLVGRLIGAMDAGLGQIRRLQIGNWGTQINNFLDTNVLKNSIFGNVVSGEDLYRVIKTNETAPRYGLMGENIAEAFSTDLANYAYGTVHAGPKAGPVRRALGAVEDAHSEAMNAMENTGRVTLGGKAYEYIAGKLIDAGMAVEDASKLALTEATRFVDQIHVDYANLSPFEKVLRRATFLYPRFNVNDFANYTRLALENGTEAYALSQLRTRQQEASADGKGNALYGGKNGWGGLIGDPALTLSPVRTLEAGVQIGRALTGEEKMALVPLKVTQAVYGTTNPLFDSMAQAMGVAPAQDKGALTKWDNLVAGAAAAIGREAGWDINIAPSDAVLKPLGLNPATKRDAQWSMAGKFEQAVALRKNEVLETEEAKAVAQVKTMLRAGLSLISPVAGRSGGAEDIEVMNTIRDINDAVAAAPPEDQQAVKELLLSKTENRGVAPFIRKTPDEKLRAAIADEGLRPIYDKAVRANRNPDSLDAAADRTTGSISGLARNVAHLLVGGPAAQESAAPAAGEPSGDYRPMAEVSAGARQQYDRLLASGAIERISGSTGMTSYLGPSGNVVIVTDPKRVYEDAGNSSFLNNSIKPLIAASRSPESIAALIHSFGGEGDSAIKKMLVSAAKVDGAFWQPVYENYLGAVSDGKEGGFLQEPPGAMRSTRQGLLGWLNKRVFEAGIRGDVVMNWTVDQARAELAADVRAGKAPAGIDFSRGDADIREVMTAQNLRVIKDRIHPNALSSAARNYEREQASRYPEMGRFVGMLQEAVRPGFTQAKRLSDAIAFGREGVAKGTLPPNLYDEVNDNPRYRDLYQRVERAAMVPQADAVWDHITLKRDGKVIGVDPVALTEIASLPKYAHWKPALQHLASGDGGDYQARAIETALDDTDPDLAPAIRGLISSGAEELPRRRAEIFEAMTGRETADFRSAISGLGAQSDVPAGSALPPLNLSAGVPAPASVQAPRPAASPELSPSLPAGTGRSQFNLGFSGLGSSAITSPAAFVSTSWNNYSTAHAQWSRLPPMQQDFKVEPSFGASISQTWRGMANPDGSISQAQVRVGVAGVSAAWQLAQLSTAVAGAEIPAEVSGVMTGLTTGFSTMMMLGGPNPVGIVAGVAAGAMSGFLASKGGGRQQAFNAEANRINQERLNLERERFQESLKQQSIRDLRTREQDLARAIGSFTPQQRQQVGEQLAKFQRRPTFQSRIGLVDAAERAVGSAIKPRY